MSLLSKEECKSTRDIAEYLLQHFPICRDDSHEMYFLYLDEFKSLRSIVGDEAYEKFKTILLDNKTLSFDAVVKSKSKLQTEGHYWGESLLAKKRIDDMREKLRERQ